MRQAFLCGDKFLSDATKPPYLIKIRRRLWLASITSKGKAMRKTLGICLLVLLLTGSAVAGEIPNGSPTPPPQTANAVQEPTDAAQDTTAGEIPNGATDTLTQTVLDLLAVLPSLL